MSDEGFFSRWARRKSESRQGVEPAPEPGLESAPANAVPVPVGMVPAAAAPAAPRRDAAVAGQAAPAEPPRLPTMDDVAQLTNESDFSAFVARGVDQAVRRGALKKLFADPHFNVMDRLDMYMDDYNVASPVSEEMLASLKHSQSFFDRAAEEARKRAEAAAAAPADAGQAVDAGEPAPQPALSQVQAQADMDDDPAAPPVAAPAPVRANGDTLPATTSTTTACTTTASTITISTTT